MHEVYLLKAYRLLHGTVDCPDDVILDILNTEQGAMASVLPTALELERNEILSFIGDTLVGIQMDLRNL